MGQLLTLQQSSTLKKAAALFAYLRDKMKAYTNYKKWWIKHEADFVINQKYYNLLTPEEAFKEHINNMDMFTLMETLELWHEDN